MICLRYRLEPPEGNDAGRQVQIGLMKLLEVFRPSCGVACFLQHMFQAVPCTLPNEPKLGAGSRLHGSANGLHGLVLFRNPVQRIERDDEVELLAVSQFASVSHLETEVGMSRRGVVA